jgi:putative peptidoglycan lipid II flippase
VRLLFEHGRFGPSDTAATAAALRLFAIGLVGYSTARIASPVFYALGRSRTPVIVSVSTIALNLLLSVALVGILGFEGLPLATSLCAIFNAGVLISVLSRHLGGFDFRGLSATLLKTALASALMAVATNATMDLMVRLAPDDQVLVEAFRVTVAITAGMAVLIVAGLWLGIAEVRDGLHEARRRLRLA